MDLNINPIVNPTIFFAGVLLDWLACPAGIGGGIPAPAIGDHKTRG